MNHVAVVGLANTVLHTAYLLPWTLTKVTHIAVGSSMVVTRRIVMEKERFIR